jgi:hypothetical protein
MPGIRNAVSAAALVAFVGLGAAPAFAANLVRNGSFEDGSGNTSPNFFLSDNAGTLTGWTTASNADSNNVLFASPTGADPPRWRAVRLLVGRHGQSRWGQLCCFRRRSGWGAQRTMSQMISGLTVGQTYALSFDWAATQFQFVDGASFDCSGCWNGPTTNEMEVTFGGVTKVTSTVNVPAKGFIDWMTESFSFTIASTSELLSFLAVGAPQGAPPVALLDGVSLTGVVPGAPEPATWAMMGLGFAGLGVVAYRRRRKALAIG